MNHVSPSVMKLSYDWLMIPGCCVDSTSDSQYSGTLVSRHPRDAKKVSVLTRAGHSRDCKNTVFVWELRKAGSCDVKAAVSVRLKSFHRIVLLK